MYAAQLDAYRTARKTAISGRDIEASVLSQTALKLKECRENWDAPDRHQRMNDALRTNQMIWTIFQSELSKEDHPLPKKLRQDILSLSLFVDKRTLEVLSFPAPEKLDMIIKINLNLAEGLGRTS